MDRAKKAAVRTSATYEEFRQRVLAAELTPVTGREVGDLLGRGRGRRDVGAISTAAGGGGGGVGVAAAAILGGSQGGKGTEKKEAAAARDHLAEEIGFDPVTGLPRKIEAGALGGGSGTENQRTATKKKDKKKKQERRRGGKEGSASSSSSSSVATLSVGGMRLTRPAPGIASLERGWRRGCGPGPAAAAAYLLKKEEEEGEGGGRGGGLVLTPERACRDLFRAGAPPDALADVAGAMAHLLDKDGGEGKEEEEGWEEVGGEGGSCRYADLAYRWLSCLAGCPRFDLHRSFLSEGQREEVEAVCRVLRDRVGRLERTDPGLTGAAAYTAGDVERLRELYLG